MHVYKECYSEDHSWIGLKLRMTDNVLPFKPKHDPEPRLRDERHPLERFTGELLSGVASSGRFSAQEIAGLIRRAYLEAYGVPADEDLIAAKVSSVCGMDVYDDEDED